MNYITVKEVCNSQIKINNPNKTLTFKNENFDKFKNKIDENVCEINIII